MVEEEGGWADEDEDDDDEDDDDEDKRERAREDLARRLWERRDWKGVFLFPPSGYAVFVGTVDSLDVVSLTVGSLVDDWEASSDIGFDAEGEDTEDTEGIDAVDEESVGKKALEGWWGREAREKKRSHAD